MKIYYRIILLFLLVVVVFPKPALAEETQTIDVIVNANEDDHRSYNYEAQKDTRQMPHNNEYYKQSGGPGYYDKSKPGYGQQGKDVVLKWQRIYTRQELENLEQDAKFDHIYVGNQHQSVLAKKFRSPFDRIQILVTIDGFEYPLQIGFISGLNKKEVVLSVQLIAKVSLEAIDAGANFIHIYGEGAKIFLQSQSWGFGIGGARNSVVHNDLGSMVNAGAGYYSGATGYEQRPWLHAVAVRKIGLNKLYHQWEKAKDRHCGQGLPIIDQKIKFNQAPSKKLFYAMLDTWLVQNWINGQLTFSCDVPKALQEKHALEQTRRISIKQGSLAGTDLYVFYKIGKVKPAPDQEENIKATHEWLKRNYDQCLANNEIIVVKGSASPPASAEKNSGVYARKRSLWGKTNLVDFAVNEMGKDQAEASALIVAQDSGEDELAFPENDNFHNQHHTIMTAKLAKM